MATFRSMASAALCSATLCAGMMVLATTCQPAAGQAAAATTAESGKPAAKPLQVTARRARGAAAARLARASRSQASSAAAKGERSARHKSTARRWATRARHAKAVRAGMADEEAASAARSEPAKTAAVKPIAAVRKPALPYAPALDGSDQPSSGFAAIWSERTKAGNEAEPTPPPQAREPVAAPVMPPPIGAAPKSEANEIDLAASNPAAPSDSFWLRGLFLALGGLIAIGSALRLFV